MRIGYNKQFVRMAKTTMTAVEKDKYCAWRNGDLMLPEFDWEQMMDVFEELDLEQPIERLSTDSNTYKMYEGDVDDAEITAWFYSNMTWAVPLVNAIIKVEGIKRKTLIQELQLVENAIENASKIIRLETVRFDPDLSSINQSTY